MAIPLFGPNIKLLRTRRGRSQEETAIALEVKRSSYSGYENGTAEPNLRSARPHERVFQDQHG
jgi:transcriptional regulator with XRE-family HTH domain